MKCVEYNLTSPYLLLFPSFVTDMDVYVEVSLYSFFVSIDTVGNKDVDQYTSINLK